MTTDSLRTLYLDYFKTKSHRVFPSDSLVPADDPSLLFTGAGMNQFKPYFLGLKKDLKRAASCQKCLRTADLDRVGKTATHHTFFEMLGNFSFGDYFKEEAIRWGWEFVTKELCLPKENLWVSVYKDDEEAFNLWRSKIGLPENRIVRMDAVDNFWPSPAINRGGSASGGNAEWPNGPCGPCSEIYAGRVPGKGVEIWNLVFTQYDRQSDGRLKDLPQKNIDTGMGLERTAAVLQGVDSNFDTDNFAKLRTELKRLLKQGSKEEKAHENAVMDHIRAIVFSIADGALPSNEGRGYVIRKLVRLASDHLTKAGSDKSGTLAKLVPAVVKIYGKTYPEIADRQKTIVSILENEENSFLEIIRIQVPKFEKDIDLYLSRHPTGGAEWSSALAEILFKNYDTYGLPKDLMTDSLKKRVAQGIKFNKIIDSFDGFIQQQRERSRGGSKISGEIFAKSDLYALTEGIAPTVFLGYETTESRQKIVRIIRNNSVAQEVHEGDEAVLIFEKTPFYAESGGQVGDAGQITSPEFEAEVTDSQYHEKFILHKARVRRGTAKTGLVCALEVNKGRRDDIMKNHTATHLLHSALRKILGDHVKQSGSLVAPDYLRFDFTHFKAVDSEALVKVEELVNEEIQKNRTLSKQEMSKEEAAREGAIAFFGEKYGDRVRVVTIGDFSKELCGGTHLESTGQIGLFKIVSEGSIQAGVRRIQAVTGRAAEAYLKDKKSELEKIKIEFNACGDALELLSSLAKQSEKLKNLKTKLSGLVDEVIKEETLRVLEGAEKVDGVKVLCLELPRADVELIRNNFEYLKKKETRFIALFSAAFEDKIAYAVAASSELVQKGFNSGEVIKEIAVAVKGQGGGRPDFAAGGSKEVSCAPQVLVAGRRIVDARLRSILRV